MIDGKSKKYHLWHSEDVHPQSERRQAFGAFVLLVVFFVLIFFLSALAHASTNFGDFRLSVRPESKIYSTPDLRSTVIGTYSASMGVRFTGVTNSWYEVSVNSTQSGYLHDSSVEFYEMSPRGGVSQGVQNGIKALNADRNAEAARHFEAALRQNPSDPAAALYLGVALARQGNTSGAEEKLLLAVRESPDSPRVNLELGRLYDRQGVYTEAEDFLSRTSELAPGTLMAFIADGILSAKPEEQEVVPSAIEASNGPAQGTRKTHKLSITLGFQYDDNVVLAPEGATVAGSISDQEDWRAFVYLNGSFDIAVNQAVTVGPSISVYKSTHGDLEDYDMLQFRPGFFFNALLTTDLLVNIVYNYEYTSLGGDEYLASHNISPQLVYTAGNGYYTSFRYRLSVRNFSDTALFLNNSERDGENHLFEFTQYIPLVGGSKFQLGLAYDRDEADLNYWSADGYRARAGLSLKIMPMLTADIDGSYYKKQYDAIYPGDLDARQDDMATISAGLTTSFKNAGLESLDLTVGASYTTNSSNIAVYEYNRAIFTVSGRASF